MAHKSAATVRSARLFARARSWVDAGPSRPRKLETGLLVHRRGGEVGGTARADTAREGTGTVSGRMPADAGGAVIASVSSGLELRDSMAGGDSRVAKLSSVSVDACAARLLLPVRLDDSATPLPWDACSLRLDLVDSRQLEPVRERLNSAVSTPRSLWPDGSGNVCVSKRARSNVIISRTENRANNVRPLAGGHLHLVDGLHGHRRIHHPSFFAERRLQRLSETR